MASLNVSFLWRASLWLRLNEIWLEVLCLGERRRHGSSMQHDVQVFDQLGDIAGDHVFALAVVGVNVCHGTITA